MARQHTMTPARRAALRKAQLVSAKKRRKKGALSQAKKSISQRRQYAKASRSLKKNPTRRARNRKIARRTALGVAGIALAGAYGAGVVSSVNGRKTRSLSTPQFSALRQINRGKVRGTPNPVHKSVHTIYKTNSKGMTLKTTHARQQYNARRRKNKPTTGINI